MRVMKAIVAYLPWIMLAPIIGRMAEVPELLLLGLIPIALGLLALPGVVHASLGRGRISLVRRSTVLLIVSLSCPLVTGFILVTGHSAGLAVIAYGIGLIIVTVVGVIAALLLLASYERGTGSGRGIPEASN
jgi:hypothetical protein